LLFFFEGESEVSSNFEFPPLLSAVFCSKSVSTLQTSTIENIESYQKENNKREIKNIKTSSKK